MIFQIFIHVFTCNSTSLKFEWYSDRVIIYIHVIILPVYIMCSTQLWWVDWYFYSSLNHWLISKDILMIYYWWLYFVFRSDWIKSFTAYYARSHWLLWIHLTSLDRCNTFWPKCWNWLIIRIFGILTNIDIYHYIFIIQLFPASDIGVLKYLSDVVSWSLKFWPYSHDICIMMCYGLLFSDLLRSTYTNTFFWKASINVFRKFYFQRDFVLIWRDFIAVMLKGRD